MNPSSAMALVSAMLGAATPLATSFFSAWVIGSSFLPQPASRPNPTTMATTPLKKILSIFMNVLFFIL